MHYFASACSTRPIWGLRRAKVNVAPLATPRRARGSSGILKPEIFYPFMYFRWSCTGRPELVWDGPLGLTGIGRTSGAVLKGSLILPGGSSWHNPSITDSTATRRPHSRLSPLTFWRGGEGVSDHPAIIPGAVNDQIRRFWRRFVGRLRRSALAARASGTGRSGVGLSVQHAPMLEAHFGVRCFKAVLHYASNASTAPSSPSKIDHAGFRKILFVDARIRGRSLARREADDGDRSLSLMRSRYHRLRGKVPFIPRASVGEIDFGDFWFASGRGFSPVRGGRLGRNLAQFFTRPAPRQSQGGSSTTYRSGVALMAYCQTIHARPWAVSRSICGPFCPCSTAMGLVVFPWDVRRPGGVVGGGPVPGMVCLGWVRAGAMYDAMADQRRSRISVAAAVVMSNARKKRPTRSAASYSQTDPLHTAASPKRPEAVLSGMADVRASSL